MSKIDHSLFSANKHALEKEYEICPQCGSELVIRNSKSGPFLGCASYPKCDFIRPLAHHDSNEIKILEDSACPECSKPLVVKNGRYGMFIGCTAYPECDFVVDQHEESKDSIEIDCPKCKKGQLTERINKFGKHFYGCNRYPDCRFLLNDKPQPGPCHYCHYPLLLQKKSELYCAKKGCEKKQPASKAG